MIGFEPAACGLPRLGSFATFNIAVRTTTAFWVQARVLALYLATIAARAC